ncbi:MAG: zinc dependent phospholipase C family protein, partial [bacterium]
MPGPLTYAAITLLARDRIGQIRRAIAAKKASGPVGELEAHVLHLLTEAERMLNAAQPVIEPPVRMYGPPVTVSRFTMLGAIGPDLPRYAAYFAPGQRWLFDTLHKGTADANRERVLANSTNLVFDFWKRVGPQIDSDISNQKKRDEAKQQMQAYVLGHLCHIAADVLSHPYFESVEARLATPSVGTSAAVRFMTRDDVSGAFDVRIADTF